MIWVRELGSRLLAPASYFQSFIDSVVVAGKLALNKMCIKGLT
jgi:hypothetical protein